MSIATLRTSALTPALFSDTVPNGVLHDVGLACWETPSGHSSGYWHYVYTHDATRYNAFLAPGLRDNPALHSSQRMIDLRAAVFDEAGYMRQSDLDNIHERFTSLCIQGAVFSPTRLNGADSYFDYAPAVQSILSGWGSRSLYLHVGMANADNFPSGSLDFNAEYAIETRQESNIFLPFVDPLFGLGSTQLVQQTSLFGQDLIARPWLHCVYSTTHPTVLSLCEQSIGDLVASIGTSARYVVHGESTEILFSPDHAAPIPAGDFSDRTLTGFRYYMRTILGLSLAQIQNRWGISIDADQDIDARTVTITSDVARDDFMRFTRFRMLEVQRRELRAAKVADPAAACSMTRFGVVGGEESWLESDFPSVGDWSGETFSTWLADREHHLELTAAGSRLSGVPVCFHTTAPAFIAATPPNNSTPPIFRAYRTYTPASVRAMFRDCLSAGSAHIGYLRTPTGFGDDPTSVTAVAEAIEEVMGWQPTALRMSGSWQRLAIHLDDNADQMRVAGSESANARTAWHLARKMRERHVQPAMFRSPRLFERPLSRWHIGRSIVVVPFHADSASLVTSYIEAFPAAALGAAIVLEFDAIAASGGAVPTWVDPQPLLATSRGVLFRGQDSSPGPVNVFYFAAMSERDCSTPDDNFGRISLVIETEVMPKVATYTSGTIPDALVRVTGSQLSCSSVTDGVNVFVAATNMSTVTANSTVSVPQDVATHAGVTYSPQSVTVPPGDTVYLHFEADTGLSSGDITTAIGLAEDNCDALEALGFSVVNQRACLAQAASLLADSHLGRAVAGVVAATRMPSINATWSSPSLTVSVRRIGHAGESATVPVEGASVQLLWPLNAGEEGAAGTTNASGVAVLAPGAPSNQRWDFTAHELVAPPAGSGDLVEVQVADQQTGASSRLSVELT